MPQLLLREMLFQVHSNFINKLHNQMIIKNNPDKITKQHKEFEVIILDCMNSKWGYWLAKNNPSIQSSKPEECIAYKRPNI